MGISGINSAREVIILVLISNLIIFSNPIIQKLSFGNLILKTNIHFQIKQRHQST